MESCPVCGWQHDTRFLAKATLLSASEYDLRQCPECGVIRFHPLPGPEELARFYSTAYYSFSRWHDEAKGKVYARRLSRKRNEGTLLDVGCALGYFLKGIRDHSSWKVHGVEFGKDAARFAREKLDLDVHEGDLKSAGYAERFFDFIHINNVLEHVTDPAGLLRECRRILRDDGVLFLSVPNGACDVRPLVDFFRSEDRPARSGSGHIFFFPQETLIRMVRESGFHIRKKRTGSVKRGLRNLGYYPRKNNWKENYAPSIAPETEVSPSILDPPAKKYPDFYYTLRVLESGFHDIPGLWNFGLDFLLYLQPSAVDRS